MGKKAEYEPETEKWTDFEGMELFALFIYSCSSVKRNIFVGEKKKSKLAFVFIS